MLNYHFAKYKTLKFLPRFYHENNRRFFASYSVIALIHFAIFFPEIVPIKTKRFLISKIFARKKMATTKFLGSYVDRGQRSQLEVDTAKLLTDKFNKQLPSSLEVMTSQPLKSQPLTSQPLTSQPLEDEGEDEEDERMEIVTVEESSSLTFYMRSSRDSPEPAVQGKNYTGSPQAFLCLPIG
jgi:hypothetical protein